MGTYQQFRTNTACNIESILFSIPAAEGCNLTNLSVLLKVTYQVMDK